MDRTEVAAEVVLRDFGPGVHNVARELLLRGGCSEEELCRWLHEDQEGIRESLAVLAKYYMANKGPDGKILPDEAAMLQRWRYPLYSVMVAELFDDESRSVTDLFLLHGKVTSKQLFNGMRSMESRKKTLKTLIVERIISVVKSGEKHELTIGEKRKRDAEASAESIGSDVVKLNSFQTVVVRLPNEDDSETIWKLNCEQLHRYACLRVCVDLVRTNIDSESGSIVDIVLRHSLLPGDSFRAADGTAVDRASVQEELLLKGISMSTDRFDDRVALMEKWDYRYMTRSEDSLYAEVTTMLETVRRRTAEDIIKKRFGKEALRLFRLLVDKKKMEARHAADLAMIAQKKAREVLYLLLEAGYVVVQEVPRSSDFKQSRCFYLWSVNMQTVYQCVADHIRQSCLNLHKRLRVIEAAPKKAENQSTYNKRVELMEQSLMRLHNALMLYQDFAE
mmetsp:Transcript_10666/g.32650  ORF Transcript_10666/g.32650 Transcript_10666/m.32650 type:complete len:449 (-) Transcript_10666:2511-3857(-)